VVRAGDISLVAVVRAAAVALVLTIMVAGTAEATRVYRSLDLPKWASSLSHCRVDLSGPQHPSGVAGYTGYNVYLLVIKHRRHVSCRHAKRLALAHWKHGPHGRSLTWRFPRAWSTTSGGSAWVGDFVGKRGGTRVEYLAVH
jgi:hypothetical protein